MRDAAWVTRKLSRSAAMVLLSFIGVVGEAQVRPPPPLSARNLIDRARAQLEAGDVEEARRAYLAVGGSTGTAEDRRDAFLGAAFAGQLLLRKGAAPADLSVDQVLREYDTALLFSGPELERTIRTNRGLLLRDAGRHAEAVNEFGRTVDGTASQRANALWNMGLSLEALGQASAADGAYGAALRSLPTHSDARRARLALSIRVGAIDTTLALAERWREDSLLAPLLTEGLLRLLERPPAEIGRTQLERALLEFAWNLSAREVGPDFFVTNLDKRVRGILARSPATNPALVAIGEAYTWPAGRAYLSTPAARWWWRDDGPDGFHAAWSSVLRTIADQLEQEPATRSRARSFYEASLEGSDDQLHEWADRRALEPLGVIYARSRDGAQADRLDRLVEQATSRQLLAPADSSGARALMALHDYHATLGRVYSRGPDSATSGARRAEGHVQSIRKIGDRLEGTGRPRPLPPTEVLKDVAARATTRGDAAVAATVNSDLKQVYISRGRPDLASAVDRRVASPAASAATAAISATAATGASGAASAPAGSGAALAGMVALNPLASRTSRAGRSFDKLAAADLALVERLGALNARTGTLLDRARRIITLRKRAAAWSGELSALRQRLVAATAEPSPTRHDRARDAIARARAGATEETVRDAETAVEALAATVRARQERLGAVESDLEQLRQRIEAALPP